MSAALPPLEELLPQAGPMRLLERIVSHDDEGTRCLVDPARSRLFADEAGSVPVWVALEWMAQCAAAHGGLAARARGEAPRPGLFVGSRRLVFRGDAFAPGRLVEVSARPVAGRGERFAFRCAVHDPEADTPLAEGRLALLVPRDFARIAGPGSPRATGAAPKTGRR